MLGVRPCVAKLGWVAFWGHLPASAAPTQSGRLQCPTKAAGCADVPQAVYVAKPSKYVVKLKPWTGKLRYSTLHPRMTRRRKKQLSCVVGTLRNLMQLKMCQLTALANDKGCLRKRTKSDHIWEIMTTCLELDQTVWSLNPLQAEATATEKMTPRHVHLHSRAKTVARNWGRRPTRMATRQ